MSPTARRALGVLLVAAALAPLIGSLDQLADRHVVSAALGLAAGGALTVGAMRLLTGGGRPPEERR